MTESFSELFKRSNVVWVIVGAILLVIAALGSVPFGSQPAVMTDPILRYGLAVVGLISMSVGGFLTIREQQLQTDQRSKAAASSRDVSNPQRTLQNPTEERVLKASAITQSLYPDPWLLENIQEIVQSYQEIKTKSAWFDLFSQRAEDMISECRRVLHGMSEGYIVVQTGGLYSISPEVLAKVKKTIKAVAAVNDAYWLTPESNTYLNSNYDAVKRKVKVVRVFTYPTNVLRGMVDILEKQQRLGIEIYIAPIDENLPHDLNEDYLILDDKIISHAEQKNQEKISIDRAEVDRMAKQFEALLRHAKRLDEVLDLLKKT
jgi:hypothetical protein